MDDGPERARELLASSGVRLHTLLARITLRADAADDLLQELFLKLSRSPGFMSATQPEAYAHRVAVRLAFDWRRAQRRERVVTLDGSDVAAGGRAPLASLAAREELDSVLAGMEALPTQAQQVLSMRFLEGQSYQAIADELGCTAHRARSICHKALTRLRQVVARTTADAPDGEPHDA